MIKIIFAFLAGAVVGAASSYAVCRHICEKEIRSVKETYQAKTNDLKSAINSVYGAASIEEMTKKPASGRYPWGNKSTDPIKCPKGLEKSEVDRINQILDDMDYNNTETEDDTVKPFQINPDEFGEDEAYGQAMLEYYEDGTVVDDDGCVLTNISIRNLVGTHVRDMFDQTDDDVIYIRNPNVMVDYMITKNEGPYYKDGQA